MKAEGLNPNIIICWDSLSLITNPQLPIPVGWDEGRRPESQHHNLLGFANAHHQPTKTLPVGWDEGRKPESQHYNLLGFANAHPNLLVFVWKSANIAISAQHRDFIRAEFFIHTCSF
jgi:uncharacterized protein YbdZ (MbtH family)